MGDEFLFSFIPGAIGDGVLETLIPWAIGDGVLETLIPWAIGDGVLDALIPWAIGDGVLVFFATFGPVFLAIARVFKRGTLLPLVAGQDEVGGDIGLVG